jgi:hypothetical protein
MLRMLAKGLAVLGLRGFEKEGKKIYYKGMAMKLLRYGARALILVWAGWWTYFGVACGIGEGMSPAGIFMHSLPGLIFLVVAGIAWRWERVGGVMLILIGLLICIGYPVMTHGRFPQLTIIIVELTFGLPPLVGGCLLLARRRSVGASKECAV